MTARDIISRFINKHGNKYDYSLVKSRRVRDKVAIICNDHGVFHQVAMLHIRGHGCPDCGILKRTSMTVSDTETYIKKARQIHGDKYKYEFPYVNARTKITIKCDDHGYFEQLPSQHLRGRGCPKCYHVKVGNYFRSNLKEFIKKATRIHRGLYDYSNSIYINSYTKIAINCNSHGVFHQTPNSHLNGQGCPVCKASKGELLIREILVEKGINFKQKYRIPNTEYRFFYDFYLPDHNLLIEFHGEQHYKPVEYFKGKEGFRKTKERDTFKKALAKMVKIPIIYFNYKDLDLEVSQFKKMVLSRIVNGR